MVGSHVLWLMKQINVLLVAAEEEQHAVRLESNSRKPSVASHIVRKRISIDAIRFLPPTSDIKYHPGITNWNKGLRPSPFTSLRRTGHKLGGWFRWKSHGVSGTDPCSFQLKARRIALHQPLAPGNHRDCVNPIDPCLCVRLSCIIDP